MRKTFATLLYNQMKVDNNIYVITADLGYKMFDQIRDEFPNRFINVGAAEQLMIGIAIGLSYEGFIPICYSITPFLLARPFELIRNYIDSEITPIKLVGSGRGQEYKIDGFSHWADDDSKIINCFKNIMPIYPRNISEVEYMFDEFLYSLVPMFLSLSKKIYD